MNGMSIFDHVLPGTGGRWLADDDDVPICVPHLVKGCEDCPPPGDEAGTVADGMLPRLGSGEPISSRFLSRDDRWVLDAATGDRCCVAHLRRWCDDCPPYPAGEMVAAGGAWATADHDDMTVGDVVGDVVFLPSVASAAQVPAAIGYAQTHPDARWFVAKRARAFGLGAAIPRSWGDVGVPRTAAIQDDTEQPGFLIPAKNPDVAVLVLVPAEHDPVRRLTADPHVTVMYLDTEQTPAGLIDRAARALAAITGPITAKVNGRAQLGDDKAAVLLVESDDLSALRDLAENMPVLAQAESSGFPEWIPHLTVGYGSSVDELPDVDQVRFDRLALWRDAGRVVFDLAGGDRPTTVGLTGDDDQPADTSRKLGQVRAMYDDIARRIRFRNKVDASMTVRTQARAKAHGVSAEREALRALVHR